MPINIAFNDNSWEHTTMSIMIDNDNVKHNLESTYIFGITLKIDD